MLIAEKYERGGGKRRLLMSFCSEEDAICGFDGDQRQT